MEQKWIMCDLHMHSQYSKAKDKSRVKVMSAETFVNTLLNYGVELFCITDHNYFSSDYCNKIEKYIKDNNLNIDFIVGAEFDTYFETNTDDKYIHICIYFDKNVDRNKLENIINNLYKIEDGKTGKPKFSDILSALFELNEKFIVIPHGNKSDRGIDTFLKNKDLIDEPEFYKYAMYKVFNAYDMKSSFNLDSQNKWVARFYEKTQKYQNYLNGLSDKEADELDKRITDKLKDRAIKLNDLEQEIYEGILEYGGYFAYFSFSDWHNNEEYKPKINNFIFKSSDNVFDSFEMATLDPESRIIRSKEKEIRISPSILKEITFNMNEKSHTIEFSPGLNAIVGKRGSGKSLLLSIIEYLDNKNDKNSNFNKYEKAFKLNQIQAKDWRGNPVNPGELSSVVFLSQDRINDIFEDPDNAVNTINEKFINISDLNTTWIDNISAIAKNIKSFNKNYKNVSSNLFYPTSNDSYIYNTYNLIINTDAIFNISQSISSLKKALDIIKSYHIGTKELEKQLQELNNLKDYYEKILDLSKSFITEANGLISSQKNKQTANEKLISTSKAASKEAIEIFEDNLNSELNYKKIEFLLQSSKFDSPKVEAKKEKNYLFVSYCDVPKDINKVIIDKLTSTIKYSKGEMSDIEEFINGVKELKKSTSLTIDLDKYISDELKIVKKRVL